MKENNMDSLEIIENTGTTSDFAGYSIDELREQCAVALSKCETAKSNFANSMMVIKRQLAGSSHIHLFGRVMSALNYVDYATLGYRIWRMTVKFLNRSRKE